MMSEQAKMRNRFLAKLARLNDSIEVQERKQAADWIPLFRKQTLLDSFRTRVERFYWSLSDEYKDEFRNLELYERINNLLIKGKLKPIE